MTEMIRIASPLEPCEAMPILAALRAQGYDAWAANLEHSRVFPSLQLALGGFPIYVPDHQADAEPFTPEELGYDVDAHPLGFKAFLKSARNFAMHDDETAKEDAQ